jgi:hypothetical protein
LAGLIGGSIARLFPAGPAADAPAGIGFMAGPALFLTCAHVIKAALGKPPSIGDEVTIDFPMIKRGARRTAVVSFLGDGTDIAGLSVASVPDEARAVRVVALDDIAGHRVQAFGTTATRPDGIWSEGVLRHPIAGGLLQVEDERIHGVPIQPGFSGSPLVDLDLGAVIGMVTGVESKPERRVAYALSGAMLHEAWPRLGDLSAQENPFRGLEPFQPADAGEFYGRDEYTSRVITQLDVDGACLVTGPSGSGKSSLVLAGALPLLRRDRADHVVFRPASGSTPWHALAASLTEFLNPGTATLADVIELGDRIRRDGLDDAVNWVLVGRDLRRLTVVVDQFDEGMARARDAALDLLAALLDAHESHRREPRLDLIITVTTEALGDLLADQRFGYRLSGHVVTLARPGQPELREIAEGPLAAEGMPVYQQGLVDALLEDIREERNPLPVLEFTLTLLWERQHRGVLTHDAYRELGGVAGALASYAEQACQQYLASDRGTADLRWVLGQLVSPVSPDRVVRRVVDLDQLEDRADLARNLAASRLVTLGALADGRPTVELAHEALVRHWPRLSGWVAADRSLRAWQDDLDRQAEQWHDGRDKARLLRGRPLRDAYAKARGHARALTRRQLAYLTASIRYRNRRWVRASLVAALVSLLVYALGAGTWLYVGQQDGQDAASAAQALLTQAQDAGSSRPMQSLALQIRAFRTHDDVTTRYVLHRVASELRFATAIIPGSSRYTGAVQPVNSDASGLVLTDPAGQLVAWNLSGPHPSAVVIPVPAYPSGADPSVAWLGTERLLTSYPGGPSIIWNARTGRVIGRLRVGGGVLVTNSAGTLLAYGNENARALREVSLASPDARPRVIPLPGPVNNSSQSLSGQVSVVDVLPGGDLLVRKAISEWELTGPGGTRALPVPGNSGWQLADGADGPALTGCVTSGSHTVFAAQAVTTGSVLGKYSQQTSTGFNDCSTEGGVLSADGRHLAVTADSNFIEIQSTTYVGSVTGPVQKIPTPPGYEPVQTVSEPDGAQRVILNGFDSTLVLLVPGPSPLQRARLTAEAVQASGKYAVLQSPQGRVEAWDMTTGRETGAITAVPGRANQPEVVADPSSDLIATLDGTPVTVRLWRLPGLTPAGVIHLSTPRGYFDSGDSARIMAGRLLISQWQANAPPLSRVRPGREEVSIWSLRPLHRTGPPVTIPSDNVEAASAYSSTQLSSDGTELVFSDAAATIRRFQLPGGTLVPGSQFSDVSVPTTPPVLDPSGRFAALAHGEVVEIWDLDSRQRVARFVTVQGYSVEAMSFLGSSSVLEVGISGPQTEGVDVAQAWDWRPLSGIPAFFGVKYSEISMVNSPSAAFLEDADPAAVVAGTATVDPDSWLTGICGTWSPNSLDTSIAGLPAHSWTGPICPGR